MKNLSVLKTINMEQLENQQKNYEKEIAIIRGLFATVEVGRIPDLYQRLKNIEEKNKKIVKKIESLRDETQEAGGSRNILREYDLKLQEIYKRMKEFIESPDESEKINVGLIKHLIITAPTQVGKTRSIIELSKACIGWLTVISCDNKIDQQKQLVKRIRNENINVYALASARKNMDKIIDNINNRKNVIIVLLNNDSQVKSLTNFIKEMLMKTADIKYMCIHDESDMVNKSDDIHDINNVKIPKSHREWVANFSIVKSLGVKTIRRVWVSATPENSSKLFNITGSDIIVLPTPHNYKGINKFIEWNGDDNSLLENEITRIKNLGNGEIILYCAERLTEEHREIAALFSDKYGCISVVYNSKGVVIYGLGNKTRKSDDTIDIVLSKLHRLKAGPIVIVGNELMNRGISFVGNNLDKPYAATVMFYKGGIDTYVINLAQKFGRITGMARPDLQDRRIYCSADVYRDYSNYLYNQQLVYSSTNDNPDLTVMEILKIVDSKKLGRKLDRPALKSVNSDYSKSCINRGIEMNPEDSEDKMKRLVTSWASIENNTQIARLFRDMIRSDGKMASELVREYFNGDGTYSAVTGRNEQHMWDLVFGKQNRHHFIKQKAVEFYRTL